MQRWLLSCGLVALALGCRAVPPTPTTPAGPADPSLATAGVGPTAAAVREADRRPHPVAGAAGHGTGKAAEPAAWDQRRATIGAGPSQPPRYDVTHAAFAERW